MISRFFIYRPIFATVISLVVVIAGVVSQGSLPIAKFPDVTPPTVEVTANYPGANAQVIASTVAAPIEQEVNGVEGMLYMSSVSADDGSYTLTVTFDIGVDLDMATVLVQNRVAIANPKLPEDVRRQGITTKKKSTSILQFIALTSSVEDYDALYLSNYATINIKDELSRIEGVGSVTVFGTGDYSMRVWLDPRKLKARGLTTQDVTNTIAEQNVQVAAGRIGQQPAPKGTAFEYSVSTLGRLTDVKEFENLIIKTSDGGRITRIKDVARVELGSQNYKYGSSFKGEPSASLGIYQLPGANALDVAQKIRVKMKELSQSFPDGVNYDVPFDTTLFVEASIAEVYTTLFQAVALVVLVIFVFLQDWRTTLIPCAAIPVSLIGTFAVMAGIGFSINMITLFGIVLAIGIVVDDAIVVVENTARHIDAGLHPKDAAVTAMNEITGPVIATTLVLLAVFVPTAFMTGITGQLYRQFALTISGAVVISTLNALTLSPALCAILMRPSPEKRNFFFRAFNTGFDWATSGYSAVINGMLRKIAIVLIVFVGLVGLTGFGFTQLPTGFLPTEDQGYCFVNVQLPDASSLERTEKVMKRIDEIVGKTDGVRDWLTISGYSILSSTSSSNSGMIAVVFDRWGERTEGLFETAQFADADISQLNEGKLPASLLKQFQEADASAAGDGEIEVVDAGENWVIESGSEKFEIRKMGDSLRGLRAGLAVNQDRIVADLRKAFAEVESAIAVAFIPPPIDGLGNAGGFQMQIQDRGSVGLVQLGALTQELVEDGNAQSGLTALSTTYRASVPQLFADIDRTKVKTLDTPLNVVFSTLQAYLGSAYVNDFNRFGRTYQVRVQADHEFRVNPDNILELDVRNNKGEMIPIGTFASVEKRFGSQSINRYNLYPTAAINGEPAPGYSSGQALELMEQMAKTKLPTTMGYEWTGMSYQEKQVGSEVFVIFGLAVLMVFLVLAAQYESWTMPAAVIAVVPLAVLGVIVALLVTGSDNNTYTQIGIVLLVALASKNAILIVEFASEQRRAGKSIFEAAGQAAALRFRAILMTAISSILGFLPLVVASGAGAASRVAVGNAVVGGMIAATIFSLLFVPAFFVVFQFIGELGTKKKDANSQADKETPPENLVAHDAKES